MSDLAAPGRVSAYPPAGLDRRFYAFAIDRVIAWPLIGLGGYLAYRMFFSEGEVWAGIGLVLGVVVLIGLAFAVSLGLVGTSPGKAVMGLRVVEADGGTPIGLGRAMLRTLVLAAATLPTFGFGVAALAQTAVADRGRRRRGWHDHLTHGVVVDVRPADVRENAVADDAPQQVVNLTAMRLAPAPPAVPTPIPPRRPPPGAPPTHVPSPTTAPPAGRTPSPSPLLPPGAPPGRTPMPPRPPACRPVRPRPRRRCPHRWRRSTGRWCGAPPPARPRDGGSRSTPVAPSWSRGSAWSVAGRRVVPVSRCVTWCRCRRRTCRSPRPTPSSRWRPTASSWSWTGARPTARCWSGQGGA